MASSITLRATTIGQHSNRWKNYVFLSNDDLKNLTSMFKYAQMKFVPGTHVMVEIDHKLLMIASCEDTTINKGSIGLNNAHIASLGVGFGEYVTVRGYVVTIPNKLRNLVFKISPQSAQFQITYKDFVSHIKRNYKGQYFSLGQQLLVKIRDKELILIVYNCSGYNDDARYSELSSSSLLKFTTPEDSLIQVTGQQIDEYSAFNTKLNLNDLDRDLLSLGVGGLAKQMKEVLVEAFATRHLSKELLKTIGLNHVRGMVLYGPPGTGKTLVARTLAKIMNATIKVINGPEILNKYVGQSEANIRKFFEEAIKESKEKGGKKGLHFIVIDELDSIAGRRGSYRNSTTDSVVTQLLTMIDGYDQLNNIFVIGTTNRLQLIDPALLRWGRLSIVLKIDRPDKEGRCQILQIHTEKLLQTGILSPTVDLPQLASETDGWTGADLAGLINSAIGLAIKRAATNGDLETIDENSLSIVQDDFTAAKAKTRPKMEIYISDFLERCRGNGFVPCGEENAEVFARIMCLAKQVIANKLNPLESLLLTGLSGTGKTTLAATTAIECHFAHVNVISPQLMIGFDESRMVDHISKVLEDAHGSTSSIIILDDIERLIDHKTDVARVLLSILTCIPPKGKNVLIIGTTTNGGIDSLRSSCIFDAFSQTLEVEGLHAGSIKMILKSVLDSCNKFQDGDYSTAAEDIRKVPIKRLYRALSFSGNNDKEFDGDSLDKCVKFLKLQEL